MKLQKKYAKFDPPLIIFTLILLPIKGILPYTCVSQLWSHCICAQDSPVQNENIFMKTIFLNQVFGCH
jgi:hypothetical protein